MSYNAVTRQADRPQCHLSDRVVPSNDMIRLRAPAAVFQPRPGLGDLIWHLPHIRAIAQNTPTGKITLITKPSTQARELLAEDPAIERIIWYDHNPRNHDPKDRNGRHDGFAGYLRFVADIRACRFESCVLLHQSQSLGAALRLAGIPERYGYGVSFAQRWWLNRRPTLPHMPPFTEAFEQATAYMSAAGFTSLPEPSVKVGIPARQALAKRLCGLQAPIAVLGIGSHGDNRQWGAAAFAELATLLHGNGFGSILLLGLPHESAHAEAIQRRTGWLPAVAPAIGWPLPEVMALLSNADLFVGNDSGLMNLRAALGRPAYGLFGVSGPLRHSHYIRPIVPPGGPRVGMKLISADLVLHTIAADVTATA